MQLSSFASVATIQSQPCNHPSSHLPSSQYMLLHRPFMRIHACSQHFSAAVTRWYAIVTFASIATIQSQPCNHPSSHRNHPIFHPVNTCYYIDRSCEFMLVLSTSQQLSPDGSCCGSGSSSSSRRSCRRKADLVIVVVIVVVVVVVVGRSRRRRSRSM